MLKLYKSAIKRVAICLCFLSLGKAGFSQAFVVGPTCVEPNTEYTYYVGNAGSGYIYWTINGGVSSNGLPNENGYNLYSLTIRFTSSSGSISVSTPNGNGYLNVTVTSPINAGYITSNFSQTVNYGATPATIGCTAATGGSCSNSYNYQWEQSTDGTNWSGMGYSSENLSFSSGLTQTSYFRRKVTEVYSGAIAYTSTAMVYVNPPLNANTVSPSSQNIFAGDNAAVLSCGPASGGGCGSNYSYQWQYSGNNSNFYDISGATGINYSPGAVGATTYYRRKVTCGSEVAYTSSVVVNVYQHLTAGSISPATYNTACNTSPGQLTGTTPAGGICGSYTYQWQSSSNNSTWSDIPGATGQNYTPGNLTATTYFRRKVTCGAEIAYSNVSTINLTYSPLASGTLTGGNSPIFIGESPGLLTVGAASNGDCSQNFSYQWQQSSNGTNFSNIVGATGLTYDPPALSIATYYRVMVSRGTETVNSNVKMIAVYPHLDPGSITTVSFNVAYNTIPSPINATASSGGNGTSYQYQWQRSTDGVNFTDISGATNQNFTFSTAQTQGFFYRRRTISGTETGYTNSIAVNIACNAGWVNCSQVIAPGGSISALTLSNSGGGAPGAGLTYQWESSTDEINWTAISGATGTTYTPASPAVTTYYRVKTGFGSIVLYTNTVRITVKQSITTNAPNASAATANQTALSMPSYPSGTDPNNQNYIQSRTFSKPGITNLATANAQTAISDVMQTTDYLDGLGRPIQSVTKGTTPSGHDMIATTWYDQFGRVAQKYLPYTDNLSSGNFRIDPDTQQPSFYNSLFNNTEGFYYSNTVFDNTPMNKVLKETAPGKSWTGSARGTRAEQKTNRVEEDVKIWTIGVAQGAVPQVAGVYNTGQLFVTQTTDESETKIIEYKNKEGQVILKKVLGSDVYCEGYSGWISTYYIYDDYGRLRWVLQPKAVEWLLSNSWDLASGITVQNELCFHYEYDARGRMIIKKVPGAGEVWIVYDNRDRPVMTQDANLRGQPTKQWLVMKYDDLNRPTGTGLLNDANDRNYHQTQAALGTIPYPSTANGYEVLTETYYDDYAYTGAKAYDATLNANLNAGSNPYAETVANSSLTKGMMTGAKTKVLGTTTYLLSTVHYDSKGRVVETRADNVSGADDITVNQYDFSGKLLSTYTRHQKSAGVTIDVLTKMAYDHAGRVLNIKKSVNGSADKMIAQMSYDALGKLKKKDLGQKADLTFLETLDHTYNIRGWLASVNKDFATNSGTNANNRYFGMELSYDHGFAQNQFNGNIGGMKWRSKGDSEQRAYGFDYDNVNRLTKADFNQYNSGWNVSAGMDFSVSNLTYDVNGNIKTIWQKGRNITGSDFIDKLNYDYGLGTGNELRNKLYKVSDNINSAQSTLGDFKDGANGGDDYDYDANGNLKFDNNKSISSISYNYMNLPGTVTVTGKGIISYVYDAGGNKLKKITTDNSTAGKTVTTTTTYIGGLVYESRQTSPAAPDDYTDKLQFISMEEGRVRPTADVNNPFAFDYFIKDHLGNVRMVLTEEKKLNIYPAATLEGSLTTDGLPNAAFNEKDYYSINSAYIVPNSTATGITVYPNKNGGPAALDPPVNNNPNSNSTANSQKLYKLNAGTNKTGLGITLKVMAGDQLNIFGRSYWFNAGGNFSEKFPIPVLGLLDAFLGSPSMAGKGIAASTLNTTAFADAASTYLQRSDNPGYQAPWAYINWVLLDEQFNYVSGGADRIGASGVVKVHDNTTIPSIPVTKNGYVLVYCSNESNYDVFFDNLQVIHTQGPLLEETHYYPFGLTMAGISSKALGFGGPENKYKFNGIEQNNDFDVNMYDAFYRNLDPQIGRFWQLDTKPMDEISLYASMNNNPILNKDPLGDTTIYFNASGEELMRTTDNSKFLGNAITVIPDKNMEGFSQMVGLMKGLGVNLSGGIATFLLRAAGESYDVQSAFDLFDANTDNYATNPAIVSTDGKGPLIGESTAPVELLLNNVWTVNVKEIWKQKEPLSVTKLGSDITIHTHENEGRGVSVAGRTATVASGAKSAEDDISTAKNNPGTGRFEMAVGKNSVYFFNKAGVPITVNRDAFAPKYFKKK